MLLFSRQGKLRLQKWFSAQTEKNKKKLSRELIQAILVRKPKMSSFLEFRDLKIVYKRSVAMIFVSDLTFYIISHYFFLPRVSRVNKNVYLTIRSSFVSLLFFPNCQ